MDQIQITNKGMAPVSPRFGLGDTFFAVSGNNSLTAYTVAVVHARIGEGYTDFAYAVKEVPNQVPVYENNAMTLVEATEFMANRVKGGTPA